jgi:hypothetical protein
LAIYQALEKNYPFIKSCPTNIGGEGGWLHRPRENIILFIKKCPINIGIVVFGNGSGLYTLLGKKTVFLFLKMAPLVLD